MMIIRFKNVEDYAVAFTFMKKAQHNERRRKFKQELEQFSSFVDMDDDPCFKKRSR